ncbi:heat-inducible transcriptional repressor HrcA [Phaeovibrio sulfidiphilus]|uniref:Heat-inducible transcription repressor HrcA n=1 Tax=Phaeovibrio sulfidiphilus TaxID=1220600 RepID=A0A8J6YUS6_9PROT|nr:heat-inducible transcriptional repressor HrcA [Phaeovibrio sulfidiphilus]MBE1236132.1 heat-inducible transcriptional repressor HrcA [Phaeovibrio sulfidiphilus]
MHARSLDSPVLNELDERSRQIFGQIVDLYVETGEPVGSRTLSRRLPVSLSSASVRNVMADLEDLGLLYAPHTSAGRLPTEAGLRLFVSGLLEFGKPGADERAEIEQRVRLTGKSVDQALSEASLALSGLSGCAGVVVAPKLNRALKHIEFVSLGPGRALVVMVSGDGMVENRVLEVPGDLPPSALAEATNYLNARLSGRTLDEARDKIHKELARHQTELDALAARVVEAGIATWSGTGSHGELIVRGRSALLNDLTAVEDIERIRSLFDALETREQVLRVLDLVNSAEGVQIFIGAESPLFSVSGCSMIVAPYQNSQDEIIGAIGVIGPTRINYRRIIPLVDYTSKVLSRLIG